MNRNPAADALLARALADLDNVDIFTAVDAILSGAHPETPIDAYGLPLTPLATAAMIDKKDKPDTARVIREHIIAILLNRDADVSAAAVRLQMLAVDAHHAGHSTVLKRAVDGLVVLTQLLARNATSFRAHDAGNHARLNGCAFLANPYPSGTEPHTAWVKGWTEADRSLRTGLLPDENPGRG